MMPGSEKDKIMKFMTEQGAFYNISQVFNFVQRRSGSGRNNDGQSWSQIEFEVLTLCFNLFQYQKPEDQVSFGLTRRVFDLIYEALKQLGHHGAQDCI